MLKWITVFLKLLVKKYFYDKSHLEWFDKCPEEGSNPLVFVEQFD